MNANQRLNPTPPGYNPLPSPCCSEEFSSEPRLWNVPEPPHQTSPLHMRRHTHKHPRTHTHTRTRNTCKQTHTYTHSACRSKNAHHSICILSGVFFTSDLGTEIPFKAHLHGHDHYLNLSSLILSPLTRNGRPTLQICWMLMSFYAPKGCILYF